MLKKIFFSLLLIAVSVTADTPVNCTYEDIKGLWIIHEGPRGNGKEIDCSRKTNITSALNVQLDFPNIATDDEGNVGFWTIIYNQGFEIVINNRKYFAFSYFTKSENNVTSYCYHTFWGWSHKTGVNPSDWSCYIGAKIDNKNSPKFLKLNQNKEVLDASDEKNYKYNVDFVNKINKAQSSWKAENYDFMNSLSKSDLIKMAGGKNSKIIDKPKPAIIDLQTKKLADSLPNSFDWTNINGVSYVSPIRNQGTCGSCYAFASMAMNEARLRIKSNNLNQTIFSTQDIIDCSKYSQGCDGGFPYLIGGKYAEDFGLVEESCNPYKGQVDSCKMQSCSRTYSTNYHYIGGFYGACNEALMRIELVKNGPIAVSFEVYDDFLNYKSGVYHHVFLKDEKNFKFNPFELTNHVVLIVGYGTDSESGEDYWLVKNSWGTSWGESGFFRIRRGTDECAIESIAVGSEIVL